jgi:murein DD-endopeptidase MepM/ murein hydrolase activator NlpD
VAIHRRVAVAASLIALVGCDRIGASVSKVIHRAEATPVAPPPPPVDAGPVVLAPPAPKDNLQQVSVVLQGAMEDALSQKVSPEVAPSLALVLSRLTNWWFTSKDQRVGDTLTAVFEIIPGKEPLVHAVRYTSLKLGKTFSAYYYQPAGAPFGRYYEPDGQEVELRIVDSPIDSYEQITSLLNDGRHHKGVDFKCPVGTPVVMPFDGTLLKKNWNWHGNGNCLEFQDAHTGRHAIFLHLSPLPATLTVGQHFKKGDQVALTGNTGHTTAPHLHYQLEDANKKVLDPFQIHATYRKKLEGPALAGFEGSIPALDARLGSPAAPKT